MAESGIRNIEQLNSQIIKDFEELVTEACKIKEEIEVPSLDNLEALTPFTEIIDTTYESWTKSDIYITVIAGLAGIATSAVLRYEGFGARKLKDGNLVSGDGLLGDLHGQNFREKDHGFLFKLQKLFAHPNNPMDNLEGAFHRLRYGHDFMNWSQEAPDGTRLWNEMMEKHGGTKLHLGKHVINTSVFNVIGRYLALYFFDACSKEGLPLPFSSFLNKPSVNKAGEHIFVNALEQIVHGDQHLYATFLTVKARDIMGSTLTSVLLRGYRQVLKGAGLRVEKNQKFYEMNCVAHMIVILGSMALFMVDNKAITNTASLNYPSIGLLLKNAYHLNRLVAKNRRFLDKEFEQMLHDTSIEGDTGPSLEDLIEQALLYPFPKEDDKYSMCTEFNPKQHKFTYHPETSLDYYLSEAFLQEVYVSELEGCEEDKERATLEYIKTMEEAHRFFCLGKIDGKIRRQMIDKAKEQFIATYGDRPQHANATYDRFYKAVNEGRW